MVPRQPAGVSQISSSWRTGAASGRVAISAQGLEVLDDSAGLSCVEWDRGHPRTFFYSGRVVDPAREIIRIVFQRAGADGRSRRKVRELRRVTAERRRTSDGVTG